MHSRLRRRVFSYAANAILLVPLAGCAALQEPAQSISLASLRDGATRAAEAATLSTADFFRRRLPLPAAISPKRPTTPLPDTLWLPAYITHVESVSVPFSSRLLVPNYRLALSLQARKAAYGYRAGVAQAAGHHVAAIDALTNLLALDANNSGQWLRLAMLQQITHQDAAAATSLDFALRYDAANDAARLERARLLQRLGRPAAALADYNVYLARHLRSPAVLRMRIDAARAAGDRAATIAAIDAYIVAAPNDVAMLRVRGDELAASGDDDAALAAWKAYAQRRPADADVLKQIAYASERRGDMTNAIGALEEYVALEPSDDRMKLALAYDQSRAGHPELAARAFAALEHSPDTGVATQAAAELRARLGGGAAHSTRAAYATVQYDSRFGDTVFGIDTFALAPARRLQPYAVVHSWDDTRSSARAYEPVVYNDNAEVFGGGLRYNLGSRPGKYLFFEAGEQISLIGRGTSPQVRYGFASWSESGTPGYGHTSFGFSLTSFSRYGANVIGYGNVIHDFPLWSGLRGIVGTNFALDTHREYWNNVGELEVGVKVGTPRLSFTLAGVDGVYLRRGSIAPPKRFYTTLRPSITWSPHL